MQIRFIDRTNSHIDTLVNICWEARGSHKGEVFLKPERSEDQINQLINDEKEKEPPGEYVPFVDLSKFSQVAPIPANTSRRFQAERILIAVDSGIAHLGEFIGGAIGLAVRGSAVCLVDNIVYVLRYNTGALLIDSSNILPVFGYIGNRLGNEELYLNRLQDGRLALDLSVLGDINQVQDRCRNFVERMIQEEILGILVNNGKGILLLDGALPAGTYDTPEIYLSDMLRTSAKNGIDVIAVSKKSRISVAGKPIGALFDEDPEFTGYVPLKNALAQEREAYVKQGLARSVDAITLANELYAVRFGLGPPALTFRVDTHNSIRSTAGEVLENTINQCQIQGCYPKPLIEAHQFSSFLFQDVQLLTSDLVVRTGAKPKENPSMSWMFEPFGALGK